MNQYDLPTFSNGGIILVACVVVGLLVLCGAYVATGRRPAESYGPLCCYCGQEVDEEEDTYPRLSVHAHIDCRHR